MLLFSKTDRVRQLFSQDREDQSSVQSSTRAQDRIRQYLSKVEHFAIEEERTLPFAVFGYSCFPPVIRAIRTCAFVSTTCTCCDGTNDRDFSVGALC